MVKVLALSGIVKLRVLLRTIENKRIFFPRRERNIKMIRAPKWCDETNRRHTAAAHLSGEACVSALSPHIRRGWRFSLELCKLLGVFARFLRGHFSIFPRESVACFTLDGSRVERCIHDRRRL